MRAPRGFVSGSTSFSAIYHAQFEYAWACLRRLGVPPAAQEDALQDLFLVVHRRLPEFAGRSSLKTWIFGVARRVAARHRRTEARRQRRHARLAAASAADSLAVDDDELARRDARRRLAEFLDRLDDDRRAVFVLHVYEEMTAPEIARELGVNVNTVYSRIRLAREQFEKTFGDGARVRAALVPESPPEGAQRRVWAALVLVLGGGAAATAPGAALAHGAGATAHHSMAWALGLAATALAIVATAPDRSEPDPRRADPELVTAAPSRTASARPPTATNAGPELIAGALAPRPASAELPSAAHSAPHRADTERAAAPASAQPPPLTTSIAAPASATDPDASASFEPASAAKSSQSLDRLAAEARLIADVRAALDGDRLDDALAGLRRHGREFPDGALSPERLGLRAIALCRAGRPREGQREAAGFLRDYPDSALSARVRLDCDLETGPATGHQ